MSGARFVYVMPSPGSCLLEIALASHVTLALHSIRSFKEYQTATLHGAFKVMSPYQDLYEHGQFGALLVRDFTSPVWGGKCYTLHTQSHTRAAASSLRYVRQKRLALIGN